MKAPWTNQHGPRKVLTICVTILLVASGLCGLQIRIMPMVGEKANLIAFATYAVVIELAVIVLAALGIVIALIAMFIKRISSGSSD